MIRVAIPHYYGRFKQELDKQNPTGELNRLGYHWFEVPVRHYPRKSGKATGANPRVILRAFQELLRLHRQIRHEPL